MARLYAAWWSAQTLPVPQTILSLLLLPLRIVADTVVPPRCPACGGMVDGDGRFCGPCFAALQFLGPPQCTCCGLPLPHEADPAALCGACLADPPPYRRARAPLAYGGGARSVVLALKHGRRLSLASMMAKTMVRVIGELPADAVIVPVPAHRWRLWQRGFNQAAVLAAQVAQLVDRPLAVDALERVKATPVSKGLGRKARARNVVGAFKVADRAAITDRTVILVDDVMTTGATVSACARHLRRAGARHVEVLTYTRTLREGQGIIAVN